MADQNVRVQSGVGLGMKIAFGFVMFFLVVIGGTCAACGACAVAGKAIGEQGAAEAKAKRAAVAKSDGAPILLSDIAVKRDSTGTPRLSGLITNTSDRTVVYGAITAAGQSMRLPISSVNPLKPKAHRSFEGPLSTFDGGHPVAVLDELEFAP